MFTLRIEDEAGERVVALAEGTSTLGRAEGADIRVEEPRASREHLEIRTTSGGAVIRDLGSTNGTFMGDRRILQSRVSSGDGFRIGKTLFTLVVETPAPVVRQARKRPLWGTLVTVLAPGLVLLILTEVGLGELRRSRLRDVERARGRAEAALARMERNEFESAKRSPMEEGVRAAALRRFLEKYPRSKHGEEAGTLLAESRDREEVIAQAATQLDRLRGEWSREQLSFSEYYDGLEQLLRTHGRLPEMSSRLRIELEELRKTHHEALSRMVGAVREKMEEFVTRGMYGRALAAMATFADGHPAAAASLSREIREAERAVLALGETDYRALLDRATALAAEGKAEEAAALLRQEEGRFAGTRFGTLLLLRADLYTARSQVGEAPRTMDQLALRRSYHLLAREAEELAGGGLFLAAAEKYASMLESITLPAVRAEFEERADELKGLASLLEGLKGRIAERGAKFGFVRFGEMRFSVRGLDGGKLLLKGAGGEIARPWSELGPEEVLALLRRAGSPAGERLLVAAYCAEMGLSEAFDEEILAALGKKDLREAAGRLFARKEGVPYPEGGFLAHKGRILTGPEYAEEVHKERIAKLRDRQVEILERVGDHPVFKKLKKIRDVRRDLDRARDHALALIFDEVKYFYPYRDRWKEYTPVMMEVLSRVKAVREVWENPARVTLKPDAALSSLLKEAEEKSGELRELKIETREFERSLLKYTIYLGRTLTVQTFFYDRVELELLEYDRRVMEWNAKAESVATDPERRQVEITNEYRMMMGRRALVLDDRLVNAARGHSEEMAREGYFGHFSPHPERRTPQQRMKLAGYTGSGASENCHSGSGSPEGAHKGWLRSSGHHRNILNKYWTEMGTGHSGRLWTQNFGRTKPKAFPEEGEEEK